MTTNVSATVRTTVRQRARQRCERCLVPTPDGHIHHRRSRSVHDRHTHCCCNLVYLCPTCHVDVHQHPFDARGDGWIVSRYVLDPSLVVLRIPLGERSLDCAGGIYFRSSSVN